MGTVHHLPSRLRVVEPSTKEIICGYREREIRAVVEYTAKAASHISGVTHAAVINEAGFVRTQHDLEAALFHTCFLVGAIEEDRELIALLLRRKQERRK